MARTKHRASRSRPKWVQHSYKDHAGQPAALLMQKSDSGRENGDLTPMPQFAFQVYSTIPLDSDHTALCDYLSLDMDFQPKPSFEIYAPGQDAFACVEHQRHEIAYWKRVRPGVDFFPGIAKVVPDEFDLLLQGFLLVITSETYQTGLASYKQYEEGTGPLWVNFNRSFPGQTIVDIPSRYVSAPAHATDLDLNVDDESELCMERNEITVQKCQDIHRMRFGLKCASRRSLLENETRL